MKAVPLCKALCRRKLHLMLQKFGTGDATSYGVGAILINFS